MRPVPAQAAQVVTVAGHVRGVGERVGDVVVEPDPLQLEEPQRVRDLHVLLLDHGFEIPRLVVVDVDGAAQADVGAGARDGVVDLRDLGQGGCEAGGVELGDPAAVALGEGVAGRAGVLREGAGSGGVDDDPGQVPAHALRARSGGGDGGHA